MDAEDTANAQPGKAVPQKCIACSRQLHSAAVCDYCHTLNPVSAPTDYFSLLGVPQRFDLDVDDLRRRYLELSRYAHPDYFAGGSQEAQELSLRISSSLNDAYRTLDDPYQRAEYLLEILGGPSSAKDKSTPDDFLDEMMVLQEQLAEAKSSGDARTLQKYHGAIEMRLAEMMSKIASLFGEFESQVGCEGTRLELLARLRRKLNAVSYLRRLLAMAGQ